MSWEERVSLFKSKLSSPDERGCMNWMGCDNGNGYGVISAGEDHKPRNMISSRFAWVAEFGPIPDGMLVCHHCDNRKCCNPAHLFLGKHKENNNDSKSKGRNQRGIRHWNARLSEEQIMTIRSMKFKHGDKKRVAAQYGINPDTLTRILSGAGWSHLSLLK